MLDPVLNKQDSIERCIQQIRRYYALPSDKAFADDQLKQDAIAANLQRLCQSCIDLANLTVRKKKLGLPKDSAESFTLLAEAAIIDTTLAKKLRAMVGFRNVLVHQYTEIDLALMVEVIEHHLDEPIDFAQRLWQRSTAWNSRAPAAHPVDHSGGRTVPARKRLTDTRQARRPHQQHSHDCIGMAADNCTVALETRPRPDPGDPHRLPHSEPE